MMRRSEAGLDRRRANGAAGSGFTKGSVHGIDLTFAAPKSVSCYGH
jgi:hypothetical protein